MTIMQYLKLMFQPEVYIPTEAPLILQVKKVNSAAKLPAKAHAGDLGYDLYSLRSISLLPNETRMIPTGIAIQFPEGFGGIIKDRSSMVVKNKIFTSGGVIDNGYTGEISVVLTNRNDSVYLIQEGDKIAQLILVPTTNASVTEVNEIESADGRNDRGFGSTGRG